MQIYTCIYMHVPVHCNSEITLELESILYAVLHGYMLYSVIIFVRRYTGTCIIFLWQKFMDIYVCLFVCLSPSLSSNTYDCWPLVAYSMHWTPSVQKLWTLWLNSFLSRKHKIEILDLIPVVMCNVGWISLHFSSPKSLLKIQTIQQVLVFADVHEIII